MAERLNSDTSGFVGFILLIILGIILIFIIVPVIIGWAVLFLFHIFTKDPEMTGWWLRWFVGIAILILVMLFKPDLNVVKNYYSDDLKIVTEK